MNDFEPENAVDAAPVKGLGLLATELFLAWAFSLAAIFVAVGCVSSSSNGLVRSTLFAGRLASFGSSSNGFEESNCRVFGFELCRVVSSNWLEDEPLFSSALVVLIHASSNGFVDNVVCFAGMSVAGVNASCFALASTCLCGGRNSLSSSLLAQPLSCCRDELCCDEEYGRAPISLKTADEFIPSNC